MAVIPGAVRDRFDAIVAKAGTSFSLGTIIEIVQVERMKPLHIVDLKLASSISGYALGLVDADVIAVRSNIELDRRSSVILHECAHLLLGHVEIQPYTYRQFTKAHNKMVKILRHEPVTAYDNPIEYAAETLAMLLWERVREYEELYPPKVVSMYGYKL